MTSVDLVPAQKPLSSGQKTATVSLASSQPHIARKDSILARLWFAISMIAKANVVTFTTLWAVQRKATTVRVLIGIGAVFAPILTWWGSGKMVDSFTRTHSMSDVVIGTLAVVTSLAMGCVIPVALGSLERKSDNWVFELIFGKLTRKMITFSQESLSDPVLAEQAKQVKERAVWRMMTMARSQPQLIRNAGMLIVSGGIVGANVPILLLIVALFAAPSVWIELRHAQHRSETEERLAPVWGALWGDLYSLMVAPTLAMLHLFGAALWFAGRYRAGLAVASKEECKVEDTAVTNRVLAALLASVGLAISVVVLVMKTHYGSLKVGEFMLVLGAISSLAGCFSELASQLGQQWSQSKSIQDFTEFLRHPRSEGVSHHYLPHEQEYGVRTHEDSSEARSAAAELTFEDVWYRYPSAAEGQHAVRGISFSVQRGSVVAVVGPNGAGKSSTMALMLRQLRPTHGRIMIDGQPIDQMTDVEFAERVVMLPQQLRHFNLTLRELLNLGRSRNPAADEVLWSELERIGAASFVRAWKGGLDTSLGIDRRNAIEPSGGQLQRLLLASVVIADRGLIVLDEPVSAVDPEAAKRFWDALFEETTSNTVVFSTHHLGAVRRADTILFIEDGRLAVHGTHDDLMERSSQYRRLFEAQASDYR